MHIAQNTLSEREHSPSLVWTAEAPPPVTFLSKFSDLN